MIFPSSVALLRIITQSKYPELFITRGYGGSIELDPEAEVPSLLAKFVLERVGDSDLVHIRSCYRNKYLCRTDESNGYIVAASGEPVDDKYAVKCTLFKVTHLGSQIVTFTHVGTGRKLGGRPPSMYPQQLAIMNVEKFVSQFKVVSYDSLVRFPKRVMFKGHNGLYLRCCLQNPNPEFEVIALQLIIMAICQTTSVPNVGSQWYNDSGSKDGSERSAHYEITHYNGCIRIKSLGSNRYLKRCTESRYDGWILGEDNSEMEDKLWYHYDSLFKVENLGENGIALRNLGNQKVCTPLSNNCLKATEDYVTRESRFVVEEPVARRKVEAQYKLSDAKITSRKFEYHSTLTGVNNFDYTDEMTFPFKYNKTRTTTWNRTTTVTKSVNADINIPIPKYIDGKIHLSSETVENTHFEKSSTYSFEANPSYKTSVPPKHKAIIKGYVEKVTYDIPCSFIQTDTYTTGESDTIIDENSVCHGFEACNFHFEKEFVPLHH